jgi:hypothetical protein
MPEVRVTWGCITIKVSPTRGITVQPQGGPSPPRVRATVQFTTEQQTPRAQCRRNAHGPSLRIQQTAHAPIARVPSPATRSGISASQPSSVALAQFIR